MTTRIKRVESCAIVISSLDSGSSDNYLLPDPKNDKNYTELDKELKNTIRSFGSNSSGSSGPHISPSPEAPTSSYKGPKPLKTKVTSPSKFRTPSGLVFDERERNIHSTQFVLTPAVLPVLTSRKPKLSYSTSPMKSRGLI
mmetsp:Transcript_24970/g.25185  ORF Transcript_24970/g.25185 Transcript_24970/m.25185 type:complete len:141 (+) Transcript_24970:255-677(+)